MERERESERDGERGREREMKMEDPGGIGWTRGVTDASGV